MKTLLILAASVVLISGIVFSRTRTEPKLQEDRESFVAGESDETLSEGDQNSDTDFQESVSSYSQEPTSVISPTSKPQPTDSAKEYTDINTFIYPGSQVINSDSISLNLEISDDPDKITDWYKEKIRSLDMNVKSFVTTKVNESVLNKLVGANENLEISVEIKQEDSYLTDVSVNIKE